MFHYSYLHDLTVILKSCTATLPAALFLPLPVVMVVVLTCDSLSLSSSELESVVKIAPVILPTQMVAVLIGGECKQMTFLPVNIRMDTLIQKN